MKLYTYLYLLVCNFSKSKQTNNKKKHKKPLNYCASHQGTWDFAKCCGEHKKKQRLVVGKGNMGNNCFDEYGILE